MVRAALQVSSACKTQNTKKLEGKNITLNKKKSLSVNVAEAGKWKLQSISDKDTGWLQFLAYIRNSVIRMQI